MHSRPLRMRLRKGARPEGPRPLGTGKSSGLPPCRAVGSEGDEVATPAVRPGTVGHSRFALWFLDQRGPEGAALADRGTPLKVKVKIKVKIKVKVKVKIKGVGLVGTVGPASLKAGEPF